MIASLFNYTVARAMFLERERKAPPTVARILKHAITTVPFYRDKNLTAELDEFPLVTRADLRDSMASFRSSSFSDDLVTGKSTSGSSGMPITVYRDSASQYQFACELWNTQFAMAAIRRPQPFGNAVLIVNDNPLLEDERVWLPSMQYASEEFLILGKSEDRDRRIAARAAHLRPRALHGRPRGLLRLAELSEECNVTIRASAVVCSGDNLYDNDRERLRKAFAAPVHNAYTSVECGHVSFECRDGSPMAVVPQNAFCEVLLEDGSISESGHGQLVITNLQNMATCFPRYVTGDVAELETTRGECGRLEQFIKRIDGRVSTYFYVDGKRLNPAVFNKLFEALPIRQFQLSQTAGNCFSLRMVCNDLAEEQRGKIEVRVLAGLRPYVGNSIVDVTFVERIGEPGKKVQRYDNRVGNPSTNVSAR